MMDWITWGVVFFILWVTSSFVALLLMMAIKVGDERCTCDGDYDDDMGRVCPRCHE